MAYVSRKSWERFNFYVSWNCSCNPLYFIYARKASQIVTVINTRAQTIQNLREIGNPPLGLIIFQRIWEVYWNSFKQVNKYTVFQRFHSLFTEDQETDKSTP